MNRTQILEEIIEGYRNTIYHRYQYQIIKENYEIPNTITEQTVDQLRDYFLDYIYPESYKRAELNEAFNSLDHFIKHPKKLIRIVLAATRLIFNYGRHLPKILNTGLKAMKSFRAATDFENNMVDEVIRNKIDAPYSRVKIDHLIKKIPHEKIESFIEESQSLFATLHDKILIKKIKEIIKYLIFVMKKDNKTYSPSQIKGLELGLEMLEEGDKLFNQLGVEDQQNLVFLITEIERDMLSKNL